MSYKHVTRRDFLRKATAVSAGLAADLGSATRSADASSGVEKTKVPLLPNASSLPNGGQAHQALHLRFELDRTQGTARRDDARHAPGVGFRQS